MSKCSFALCVFVACCFMLLLNNAAALPRPQEVRRQQRAVAPAEAEQLDTGAAAEGEKDDLQGSASYGYGYYSSYPYLGGYHGGYYPHYSTYYGLGYPYYGGLYGGLYGGYYGGHHDYHGHYF